MHCVVWGTDFDIGCLPWLVARILILVILFRVRREDPPDQTAYSDLIIFIFLRKIVKCFFLAFH